MAERQYDEKPEPESRDGDSRQNQPASEPDLRSLLQGGARRRTLSPEPPGSPGRGAEARDRPQIREPGEEIEQKLPPVWPGDEDKPWFRRERGLPPLPGQGERPSFDLEDLPTPLADIPTRGRAYGIGVLLPNVLSVFLPTVGLVVGTVFLVANLFLFRQGQDIGALLFRLRVVRENGDVAGFFHMFVRNAASAISLIALGAGFWSALSDPERRTWHDKWLKTYVVKDSDDYKTRKRSSSETAFNWFWIIILLAIAISILLALSSVPPAENMPPE